MCILTKENFEISFNRHLQYALTHLIESPPSCLLRLHLGEVVVVGDKVGHDGLVVRSLAVHICQAKHMHMYITTWRMGRGQGTLSMCIRKICHSSTLCT